MKKETIFYISLESKQNIENNINVIEGHASLAEFVSWIEDKINKFVEIHGQNPSITKFKIIYSK